MGRLSAAQEERQALFAPSAPAVASGAVARAAPLAAPAVASARSAQASAPAASSTVPAPMQGSSRGQLVRRRGRCSLNRVLHAHIWGLRVLGSAR